MIFAKKGVVSHVTKHYYKMKKFLLLLMLLPCGSHVFAQKILNDSIHVSDSVQVENNSRIHRNFFEQHIYDMYIESLETEYDFICDYVDSEHFVTYRNNQYLLVDTMDGSETVIFYDNPSAHYPVPLKVVSEESAYPFMDIDE